MKSLLAMVIVLAPLASMAAEPDDSFYKKAAEAGMYEVDAGKQAQEKGTSEAVKGFGAMMVKDHTAAGDKLQALAQSKNISLPTSASVGEMASKAKLDVLSGDTYDKAYIKSQIKAHRAAIALFKKEISSGQDADAKAFATATLPTLQAHLRKITAIAASAGVSA